MCSIELQQQLLPRKHTTMHWSFCHVVVTWISHNGLRYCKRMHTISSSWRKHLTRNISVDHACEPSVWYDGIPVITLSSVSTAWNHARRNVSQSGTAIFLPQQNRLSANYTWLWCCTPGSYSSWIAALGKPYMFFRPDFAKLCFSEFSPSERLDSGKQFSPFEFVWLLNHETRVRWHAPI